MGWHRFACEVPVSPQPPYPDLDCSCCSQGSGFSPLFSAWDRSLFGDSIMHQLQQAGERFDGNRHFRPGGDFKEKRHADTGLGA